MSTQSRHPSQPQADTQIAAILAKLKERPGKWTPAISLALCSGSLAVHSRVHELRHVHGYNIEQENRRAGRMVHSHYRLIESTDG